MDAESALFAFALRRALEGADELAVEDAIPELFLYDLITACVEGAEEAILDAPRVFADVDTSWVPALARRYTRAVARTLGRAAVQRVAEATRVESAMRSIAKGRGTGADNRERLLEAIRVGVTKRESPELARALQSLDLELQTRVAEARTAGALAAGRHAKAGLRFVAMHDDRVRPNHAAADGLVAHSRDPVWLAIAPPLGFNCRCGLRVVPRNEVLERGLANAQGEAIRYVDLPRGAHPDEGFTPSVLGLTLGAG